MKKLKLKLDSVKEMLTKDQMKKISGGYACSNWATSGHCWDCCKAAGHNKEYCDSWCG